MFDQTLLQPRCVDPAKTAASVDLDRDINTLSVGAAVNGVESPEIPAGASQMGNGQVAPATPTDQVAGGSAGPTVLDELMAESAAVMLLNFLRARFPASDPRSPFAPIYAELKELAFAIAAKDPFRHLTEDDYERRLKDGARMLVSPGQLRRESNRL